MKSHEYYIILRDEFCYGKPLNTVVRIIINVMAYIYIITTVFCFEKVGLLQPPPPLLLLKNKSHELNLKNTIENYKTLTKEPRKIIKIKKGANWNH
jgi:hypothetical protein